MAATPLSPRGYFPWAKLAPATGSPGPSTRTSGPHRSAPPRAPVGSYPPPLMSSKTPALAQARVTQRCVQRIQAGIGHELVHPGRVTAQPPWPGCGSRRPRRGLTRRSALAALRQGVCARTPRSAATWTHRTTTACRSRDEAMRAARSAPGPWPAPALTGRGYVPLLSWPPRSRWPERATICGSTMRGSNCHAGPRRVSSPSGEPQGPAR